MKTEISIEDKRNSLISNNEKVKGNIVELKENFSKYQEEAKNDLDIDRSNLESSFGIANLQGKWWVRYLDWKETLKYCEQRLNKYRWIVTQHVEENHQKLRSTKDEKIMAVEADKAYMDFRRQVDIQKLIVELCAEMRSLLKDKQFEIKNIFEIRRWMDGNH